ncbi:MAG: hypothetical protein NW205_03420, partial [Hyphomicrobiaceae bacterium]|nr:hypothetical protein [Hyphomicrobiaceae bacterium]
MFGMGKLWGSRGGREKEVKFASSLASPPSPQYPRHDYYSRSYKVIKRVGHTRPTPEIGAPTLVWHLSLWPERNWDPNEVEDKSASESRQTEKCKTGDPRQFRSSIRTVIDEITPRTEAPR